MSTPSDLLTPEHAVSARSAPPAAPRHRLRAFALLVLLIAVAYGASLRNGFVFDDAIFVERDQRLQSLAGVRRLFAEPLWGFDDKAGQGRIHQYYRPLQLLAPAASMMLWKGAAWPVHLLSLVLHLACAFMVYELLVRSAVRALEASHTYMHDPAEASGDYAYAPARPTAREISTAALLLAVVFAVHPASSEAVLWASDLSGLGATACMLAVVLLHGSRLHALPSALLVALLCLGAMLFKESGVLAPALMVLFDCFVRTAGRSRAKIAADYLAAALSTAAYFALRVRALGGFLPGAGKLELGPAELVLNAFALLPSYVRAFAWPFDLNMYHDFEVARSITDPRVIAGAVLALALVAVALANVRRAPVVTFGLAWTALCVSPWLFVRWPQLNVFAERYLYLPSIGLFVAAAAPLATFLTARHDAAARLAPAEPDGALRDAPGHDEAASPPLKAQRALAVCAVVMIGAFVVRDVLRTRDWKDEVTIYTKTLEQSPRAELIRNNLALRYLQIGEPARGIPIQEELLRIDPDFPSGWHNMGLLMLAVGRNDDARIAFEKSAALEPHNAATALNLGYAYDLGGEREKAVEKYFLATILEPTDNKPWYNLAVIAYEEGQLDNAGRAVNEVLSRAPDDRAAKVLHQKLAGGQAAPSAADVQTERTRQRITIRRCNTARAAAEAGRPREAVVKLETAAWLDERSPLPHHYLANVRYLAGSYREAYRHERDALDRAPDNALYRANVAALEQLVAPNRAPGAQPPSFR